ncbi:MAG: UDP-N-acetylglucosamine 1-carboxyvinyltransferase [Patescibacteria group bacterium]|nr:UDP-N-acetylglucosamine 1-carboxyvinyltransferase [Patescibacteria group bacterium]
MSKYLIEGNNKLKGKIRISGNKNAVLPCMAAALLTEGEITLSNVPNIADVVVMAQILQHLGAMVEFGDHLIKIRTPKITNTVLPDELVSKLRASILVAGALLGRQGKVEFLHPGGDVIGKRGIDLHLQGFRQLGYKVRINDRKYTISNGMTPGREAKIFFEIATVTGTENIILASVIRKGTTVVRNAAQEPHIVDLCNMLSLMGAKISGIGTSTLVIEGVDKLDGAEFRIGSDNIEFGTYAIATAITGGMIEIENCQDLDLDPIIWPMEKMGLVFSGEDGVVKVSSKKINSIPRLITSTWPGFPTDLMSAIIVLATQARGVSLLHDWIYESRMFFVDKLISMGANITIADPHRVIVSGPTSLYGRNMETPDIRAGMSLVLAALVAKGTSEINRAELIERGYEDVVEKLSSLGVKIQKLN